jgi:hypothetical protein
MCHHQINQQISDGHMLCTGQTKVLVNQKKSRTCLECLSMYIIKRRDDFQKILHMMTDN